YAFGFRRNSRRAIAFRNLFSAREVAMCTGSSKARPSVAISRWSTIFALDGYYRAAWRNDQLFRWSAPAGDILGRLALQLLRCFCMRWIYSHIGLCEG